MFDIGFSELLLIAVLALVVLGPKRLPEVARTAGRWAGRARRFVDSVKRDMDREMDDEGLAALRDAHRSIKEAGAELTRSVHVSAAAAEYEIIEPESVPDPVPEPIPETGQPAIGHPGRKPAPATTPTALFPDDPAAPASGTESTDPVPHAEKNRD